MTSQLALTNDALVMTGENPFVSASDGSTEWNLISASYTKGLNKLLADHNWKFAKTLTQTLSRSDPDDPNYEDSYTRPPNIIHITKVMDLDGAAITDYRIVGDQIYVNEADGLLIEGIEDKDPSEWPNFFSEVMMHFLFAGIYRGLKKSPQDARAEELMGEKLLMRARPRLDSEEPVRARHVSGLLTARRQRRG